MGVSRPVGRKNIEPIIRVEGVTKSFRIGGGKGQTLEVLKGVSMEITPGQIVAVVGASGAGKSTLLHILGTLDRPSSGKVWYNDSDVFTLSDDKLARFRNRNVGFVFQFHHLLPEFTALENVAMPAMIGGVSYNDAVAKARNVLTVVGLEERAGHKPPQLSGGEQQRVAVARALIYSPMVVLADEPTGNLDSPNASSVHDLLWTLSREKGQTFVIVTHNEKLAKHADRIIRIIDGKIDARKVLKETP
jgi:lipoprotein-releasing system ATP-binding protein